ncbi:glutaredoxin-like protein NrdH [Cryobacterium sp. GrIS_2_6]|uniref:glutaredoxin-like protein NrdH n=1 Tax=Cryobacterium sp. GrIS_2_6 TaxID=3162785 RepID=UPI002E05CB81|nr:glutaredoxin-like protein NrdH [Cryobacterium psychrotolerans]
MNETLTVYTLPNCMQCTITKKALARAGAPYVTVNLATDDSAIETLQQLGYTSAPVVTVGAASWSGFRPDKISAVTSARGTELRAATDELGGASCE